MAARPEQSLPVSYREKIFHPAMMEPLIAGGSFDRGAGGALIRSQSFPKVEITRIGARFITIERPDEGYKNTVPIPAELAPLLGQLRAIVDPESTPHDDHAVKQFEQNESGWQLVLTPGDNGELRLLGCGTVLTGLRFAPGDGARRDILFETQ